jgi:hypothetical protein
MVISRIVILSVAKDLLNTKQILRFAQNDKMGLLTNVQ